MIFSTLHAGSQNTKKPGNTEVFWTWSTSYSADHEHYELKLREDLVYDEAIKTDKTIIRVGEVIPNTPAEQYNHEDPTNGLVYGDKVKELDDTEICLLVPSCSRCIRKIDEVDKHNPLQYQD